MLKELEQEKEILFKKLNSQSLRGLGIRGSVEEVDRYLNVLYLVNKLHNVRKKEGKEDISEVHTS